MIIGTRGSPLALAQAHQVRDRLARAHGIDAAGIEIRVISTSGDRLKEAPLSAFGGKGLFTKEIDNALLAGHIDIGVHSAKDVATQMPDGIALVACLEREDIADAFVSLTAGSLEDMPEGAVFGTSSIRRAAQIRRARPDLVIVPFRGNVQTRLQKLADGVASATLLAMAGLNRLDRAEVVRQRLDPSIFLPAPAQGAIVIAARQGDERVVRLVAPLDHAATHIAIAAERALLGALDGSCRTPIGAWSQLTEDHLQLKGEILSPDGSEVLTAHATAPVADALRLGRSVGEDLRGRAGDRFETIFGFAG